MIKIKLLFWVFFLFAFQLAYSSTQHADEFGCFGVNEVENQLYFEKTLAIQDLAGEIPESLFEVLNNIQPSKCFLPNCNSKDFQVSIVQGNVRHNAVMRGHLFTTCAYKKQFNVPIYLQTENFRL